MSRHWRITRLGLGCLALGLAGCAPGPEASQPEAEDFTPEYLGVETKLLESDLVNLVVRMKGARDGQDVADYARCAAAQYTLIRGDGFARQVRTTASEEGGLWTGAAVYTISAELPQGLKTLDAETELDRSNEQGIPAV
mgnify:CR=1 FL=1